MEAIMHKGGFVFGFAVAALLACGSPARADTVIHFPSPNHAWTWRDYNQLYFVHVDNNLALPHLRSPDTARLFRRIVDRDNIGRVIGRSGPDDEKIRELWMILGTLSAIRARYNLSVVIGEPLSEELTQVQAFMLYALDETVRLSEEAMRSPSIAWKTCFLGVVQSLAEKETYTPAQRGAMASALTDHFAGLRLLLTAGDLQGMRRQVEALATEERDTELRQALQHLLAATARG
jgi:hypothetical protein